MQIQIPAWPRGLARQSFVAARLKHSPLLRPTDLIDLLALQRARQIQARADAVQCSGLTGTWSEAFFTNRADYTALASFTAEASLLAGVNEQPVVPALFFDGTKAFGRTISFLARGVFGTTGTPTYIFQCRLGTTAGSAALGGTSVGVSAAITTASGVTNKWWELRLDLTCNTPGIGTGNTTLSGSGYVTSPAGFASPFTYALEPTTPDTATWTAVIDASVTQYFNLSVTSSANSASNTLTLKQLYAWGWN